MVSLGKFMACPWLGRASPSIGLTNLAKPYHVYCHLSQPDMAGARHVQRCWLMSVGTRLVLGRAKQSTNLETDSERRFFPIILTNNKTKQKKTLKFAQLFFCWGGGGIRPYIFPSPTIDAHGKFSLRFYLVNLVKFVGCV